MSLTYPGGFITKSPTAPTSSAAPGVWTLDQAMQYTKAGDWPSPPPPTDPYFNQVAVLLPGDGTNGAQNNTFIDSSTNNFTITRSGNTTQGSFSPFSQPNGYWSNYFDGSTAYLTTSSSQIIPTGDFTIEVFVYCTSLAATEQMIVSQASGVTSGRTGLYLQGGYYQGQIGSSGDVTTTTSPTLNGWDYVVLRRSGSTFQLYVNGTLAGSSTNANTPENTILSIGRNANWVTSYYWNGYISNLKISNTAISVGSTPTSPLTSDGNTNFLSCQSNRYLDNSANGYAITANGSPSVQVFGPFLPTAAYVDSTNGGSGSFDGSDYLSLPTSGIIPTTYNATWTIEGWVYYTADDSGYRSLIGAKRTGAAYGFAVGIQLSTGTVYAEWVDSYYTLSTIKCKRGQWNHIAYTNENGTFRLYINGQYDSSFSSTATVSSWSDVAIGVRWSSVITDYWNGYISDVRWTNSLVYTGTGSYTVPTAPLTAIANTALLCNFVNAGIVDAAARNDFETVGNAQISTTQSKFGGSSIYLDGNGDYLSRAISDFYAFGTGDFTIEFWAYKSADGVNGYDGVCASSSSGNASGGWLLELSNNRGMFFAVNTSSVLSYSFNPNTSTWTHYALVRNNGTLSFYVNGTSVASTSFTSTIPAGSPFTVGTYNTNGTPYYFNGYIDDLRITKGVARYTANFSPPSIAFSLY